MIRIRNTLGTVAAYAIGTLVISVATAAEKPFAAPQVAEQVSPASAGSLLQVTFSLLLVLGAVFAAAWLVKRFKGFGRFGANVIQVVADAPLGPKERAVLIQVGEQQLLLGVTAGQVNLLHVLSQPVSTPLPNPPPAPGGGDMNSGISSSSSSSSFPPPVAGGGQGGGISGGRPDFAAILRRSLGLK